MVGGGVHCAMAKTDFNHLQVFLLVARERSFTRAALQLGVSQSALSHTLRTLEEQLGVRLLARSTRGVAPTEAGARLIASLEAHYEGIEASLLMLSEGRDKPAGTIRISTHDHAASSVLWPKLSPLLTRHPDIKLELNINYGLIDIVAERYDAGVRLGDQVAQGMIAMRISEPLRMVVVAAPAYLQGRSVPQWPQDLAAHQCINLRLPTYDNVSAWEFQKDGRSVEMRVDGQCIFSTTPQKLEAALAGHGFAWLPQDMAAPHLAAGRLRSVLDDWSPTYPGYHLYYPSRRQSSAAFALVLDALRL